MLVGVKTSVDRRTWWRKHTKSVTWQTVHVFQDRWESFLCAWICCIVFKFIRGQK